MRILLSWLNDFFSTDLTVDQVQNALLSVGLEVDEIEHKGENLDNVVVAKIESFVAHPDAETLSLCKVNDGNEVLDIVCGAKNFKAGDRVALAKIGAKLPNGLKIKKSKIRGQESFGMLCSEDELGLDASSEGIIILDEDQHLGTPIAQAMKLRDAVFHLDLTPNRGDCFSVVGVGYDVAAATQVAFAPKPKENLALQEVSFDLQVVAKQECTFYSLSQMKDVKVASSPAWLKRRLEAIGLTAKNNIVDITNYIMMTYGQPLHAFDADQVEGSVQVRMAVDGEKITCLDEQTYTLTSEDLVISDTKGVLAIAGIMGGQRASVTDQTKNVFIESAYFDATVIRKTSRRLKLISDSSKRFERQVDRMNVLDYGLQAVFLIQKNANGSYQGTDFTGKAVKEKRTVMVHARTIERVLGQPINDAPTYLQRLGFSLEKVGEGWLVEVPTRRPEIQREIDLIEEIARIYGYDHLASKLPPLNQVPVIESAYAQTEKIRTQLASFGLDEAKTYSFMQAKDAQRFAGIALTPEPVAITNPITPDWTHMKSSLLPNLLRVWTHNHAHQATAKGHFFELSKVFGLSEQKEPQEQLRMAVIFAGEKTSTQWNTQEVAYDFYDLNQLLAQWNDTCKVEVAARMEDIPSCFHPGQAVSLWQDDQKIGAMGMIHPQVARDMDLPNKPIYGLEMDVHLKQIQGKVLFQEFSPFPSVHRDLSFVVPEETSNAALEQSLKELRMPFDLSWVLFDCYRGKGIDKSQKSLGYRFAFSSVKKTLSDKDIDKQITRIMQTMEKDHGATVRGA